MDLCRACSCFEPNSWYVTILFIENVIDFQHIFASRQCHYSFSKYVCILLQFSKKQEPYFPNLLFIKTRLYHDWRLLALRQVHFKCAFLTSLSARIQKQLQYRTKIPWTCTSNRFFWLLLTIRTRITLVYGMSFCFLPSTLDLGNKMTK